MFYKIKFTILHIIFFNIFIPLSVSLIFLKWLYILYKEIRSNSQNFLCFSCILFNTKYTEICRNKMHILSSCINYSYKLHIDLDLIPILKKCINCYKFEFKINTDTFCDLIDLMNETRWKLLIWRRNFLHNKKCNWIIPAW